MNGKLVPFFGNHSVVSRVQLAIHGVPHQNDRSYLFNFCEQDLLRKNAMMEARLHIKGASKEI